MTIVDKHFSSYTFNPRARLHPTNLRLETDLSSPKNASLILQCRNVTFIRNVGPCRLETLPCRLHRSTSPINLGKNVATPSIVHQSELILHKFER